MVQRKRINPWPQKAADAVGGQSELARRLAVERGRKLTPQAVGDWCRKGRIPPLRVIDVEHVSGVSRHKLAPELYPVDEAA
jgi:DNA-binding transcriptional regulator YdaS (Cro superfamily)